MAWNNGYPVTYGQMYPQGYPMAQQPAYGQQMQQAGLPQANMQQMQPTQMSGANQPTAQMMTPPTIRAEIIQVDDDGWENYVERFPLGPGASQMFMTKGEGNIIIKSMGQTGPLPLTIYDKRPPEPPAPMFDPEKYVRKDELEMLVSAAMAAQQSEQATRTATVEPKRTARKEDE